MELGAVGIWAGTFRTGDPSDVADAIGEVESLGYGTAWFPGSASSHSFDDARRLLEASSKIVIATGILNIWRYTAEEAAAGYQALATDFPDRFLLGMGVGHKHMIEKVTNRRYERPYSLMVEFLDGLDAANPPVAPAVRMLAALGPRMLALAAERTAGAHPYCIPVEHTALARDILGPNALLAPEVKVVLTSDVAAGRAIAREHLALYFAAPNYTNNLLRLGYDETDFEGGGSDRLVEALVAIGDEGVIAKRVGDHHAAGADHVCVQVLTATPTEFARSEWRALAPVLLG